MIEISELEPNKITLNQEFAENYKVYNLPNKDKMIIIGETKFSFPEPNHLPCKGRDATLILLDNSTTLSYNALVTDKERYLKVYDYNVYLPERNMIIIINTEKQFNEFLIAIEKDLENQIKLLKLALNHFKENSIKSD